MPCPGGDQRDTCALSGWVLVERWCCRKAVAAHFLDDPAQDLLGICTMNGVCIWLSVCCVYGRVHGG